MKSHSTSIAAFFRKSFALCDSVSGAGIARQSSFALCDSVSGAGIARR
jgi:hypothetical protein